MELIEAELPELRRLFDSEYLEEFGEWNPLQPCGYASHVVHVMARIDERVVGHVGWARREIVVGTETVDRGSRRRLDFRQRTRFAPREGIYEAHRAIDA